MNKELFRRYRCTYRMYWRFDQWAWSYELIARDGGLHLHVSTYAIDGKTEYSAGLEMHSRTPPAGANIPPSFDECWLLKAPCWHEGTSVYAMDHFLPIHLRGDPERVLYALCMEADDRWPRGETE